MNSCEFGDVDDFAIRGHLCGNRRDNRDNRDNDNQSFLDCVARMKIMIYFSLDLIRQNDYFSNMSCQIDPRLPVWFTFMKLL